MSELDDTRPTGAAVLTAASFAERAGSVSAASSIGERDAEVSRVAEAWATVRERAESAGWRVDRLPSAGDVKTAIADAAAKPAGAEREAAVRELAGKLDRLEAALTARGPSALGAQWWPASRPLEPPELQARLERVAAQTRGAARSLGEAMRLVVAARREHGVSLYETFAAESGQRAASVAVAVAAGFIEPEATVPGATRVTAPWGVFEVHSPLAPGELADRLPASPPLPARGELLDARYAPAQILGAEEGPHA